MFDQGYLEGVRISLTSPYHYEENVETSIKISIEVNTALNKTSIFDSVKLIDMTEIEDSYLIANFVEVFETAKPIECVVKYIAEESVIQMEPIAYLDVDKRYGILVKGLISTFEKEQNSPFYSVFYTTSTKTFPPLEPVFPADNSVLDTVPEFKWVGQDSQGYVIEISKGDQFNELYYKQSLVKIDLDDFDTIVHITPNVVFEESVYFWRVRSINGNWSPVYSFYFKPHFTVPVSQEDEVFKDAAIAQILGDPFLKEVTAKFNVKELLINPFLKTVALEFNFLVERSDIDEIVIYSEEGYEPSWSYTIIKNTLDNTSMIVISFDVLGGDS